MTPAPASGVLCWEVEFRHLLAGHGETRLAIAPALILYQEKACTSYPHFIGLHTPASDHGIVPALTGNSHRKLSFLPGCNGFLESRHSSHR